MTRPSRPVVWFNEQAASALPLPALLRDLGVHVHGSSRSRSDGLAGVCDTFTLEPEVDGPEYIEWLAAHAAGIGAQVLVARRNMRDIAHAKTTLEEAGVAVLLPSAEAFDVCEDKSRFTATLEAAGVPAALTWAVTCAAELEAALEMLDERGHRPCLKPSSGIGGARLHAAGRRPASPAVGGDETRGRRPAVGDPGRAVPDGRDRR